MTTDIKNRKILRRFSTLMGWNRASFTLMSTFLAIVFLIIYFWWPLAEEYLALINWGGAWWRYIDWLLLGIFAFMSLMIMAHADLRVDTLMVFVGFVGGLVIESWGTQTDIWAYYTAERPPLWIIPAWPIASLTIDRMVRILHTKTSRMKSHIFGWFYWFIFPIFYFLMLSFVWPTLDKSLTVMALILVTMVIISPTDYRIAVLTFLAGAGLGYFLEIWGTTRLCWTYYTLETPPIFAVLAHGMAAVAFWRAALLLDVVSQSWFGFKLRQPKIPLQ
ncbi:MAG: hypothetical protein IMY76_05735 [Chloroflexi bacterium]|nr:hypothetical protein [Chloroflexota bacterium]